jgi:ribulose-bisphosphate carboxylase large chain
MARTRCGPFPDLSRSSEPMREDRFEATYLIETPLDPAKVAEVMAGEQSCGTFTRVAGETDELRERARARWSLGRAAGGGGGTEPAQCLADPARRAGPWRRARVTIWISRSTMSAPILRRWPRSSPATSTTSARSRASAGHASTCRPRYRRRFQLPAQGIAGTSAADRRASGRWSARSSSRMSA